MRIELFDPQSLPQDVHDQAVSLTQAVFPDVPELAGKYYFDSPPDLLVTGFLGEELIAIRPVVFRSAQLGDQRLRVAGGIMPTVAAAHRNRGYARQITEFLLERFAQDGVGLSLAFFFDGAPWQFLTPFGYRKIEARFFFEDRRSGQRVQETQAGYGRSLGEIDWIAAIEQVGEVDLGLGAF